MKIINSFFIHALSFTCIYATCNAMEDTNLPNAFKCTNRIHYAAHAALTEYVEYLVNQGANIKELDENGNLPIHHAATGGNLDTVKLLISLGSPIDEKNLSKHSPLQMALAKDHVDIVRLLLFHGANPQVLYWRPERLRTPEFAKNTQLLDQAKEIDAARKSVIKKTIITMAQAQINRLGNQSPASTLSLLTLQLIAQLMSDDKTRDAFENESPASTSTPSSWLPSCSIQ